MKKTIVALALCLALLSALLFTSCEYLPDGLRDMLPPGSAEAVYERVDEAMSASGSYKMDGKNRMTVYIDEVKYELVANIEAIVISDLDGDMYYYNKTVQTTSVPDMDINSSLTSLTAYHEGNAFLKTSGDLSQKIYSEISERNFKKYFIDNGASVLAEEDLSEAAEKSHKHIVGEGWEISFKGYSRGYVNGFLSDTGLGSLGIDHEVKDIVATLRCDEDYLVRSISIEVIFDVEEGSEELPSVRITMDCSGYNEATPLVDELDVDDYTEVEDIHVLKELEDMLDEMSEREEGYFTLDTTTRVSVGAQQVSTTEYDKIRYGEDDGAFFYEIDYTINNTSGKITYKNGDKMTPTNNLKESPAKARAYIASLMDRGYNVYGVSFLEEAGDGVYVIEIDSLEDSAYKAAASELGFTYVDASQEITVTIVDGELAKLRSYVNVECKYNGSKASIRVISTADFTAEPTPDDESAL
ncbi:MAG: hypothetical protein IKC32_05105 [Clostridia bacterium]|nr:hypothetical protein [Clostridia bacterium]